MSTITPAERGWHIVRVVRTSESTLAIFNIEQITHWYNTGLYSIPLQDGKRLPFDPADLRHVTMASYLMNPQGQLLGHEGEVIANSVLELQEAYALARKRA